MPNKYILSKLAAEKKLGRMALQVLEQHYLANEIILIGIKENGIVIARKIQQFLSNQFKGSIVVLTVTMDKKNPNQVAIHPPYNFKNSTVILIDDVANSGRTMLYALQPLLQAYPKIIQTLALVERTYKSFPIALDYVGVSISTTLNEHICVEVHNDEVVGAFIVV